ncbi:MAG TPA: hemolysin family protein [Blastocatellia bacterium]|jgi:CBS domain containing-hemolysin-like protein|nr:hemolysin family protein [Blastocatellia bacterium]
MDVSSALTILLNLTVVLLLVLANGFFVAAEFALVSVRQSRVAALVAEGNRRAKTLMRVTRQLDAYISATQLGITLASLALGWIGEETLAHLLTPVFEKILPGHEATSVVAAHTVGIAVAFVVITFLHIVLGELAPKTLALERAERVALAVAAPMEIFYKLFKAPIRLLNYAGGLVLRLAGLHSTAEHAAVYSEEELRHLIALSHKGGLLAEDERQLLYNVFDFTDATLADVMLPRTEVEALSATLSPGEMLASFVGTGYSRMPVYRGSLDNIIGIVLQKDIVRIVHQGSGLNVDDIIRPAMFLPPSMRLNEALKSLRRSSAHMALIVDEHGGLEGMVTLEDLLEEIVGDIRDEHDEAAARQIVPQPDGSYVVRGSLSIRDANKELALALPESDNYHTIAGFMMARAGRLLRPEDSVEYNDLKFTVEAASNNRIIEARIEKLPEEAAASAANPAKAMLMIGIGEQVIENLVLMQQHLPL